jgi:hypothetical protein
VLQNTGFYRVASGQCYQSRLSCFTCALQCIVLSKACCGKNAEAAENGHICQLLNAYLHMQHTKPLKSRLKSAECMCAVLAFYLALFLQYC